MCCILGLQEDQVRLGLEKQRLYLAFRPSSVSSTNCLQFRVSCAVQRRTRPESQSSEPPGITLTGIPMQAGALRLVCLANTTTALGSNQSSVPLISRRDLFRLALATDGNFGQMSVRPLTNLRCENSFDSAMSNKLEQEIPQPWGALSPCLPAPHVQSDPAMHRHEDGWALSSRTGNGGHRFLLDKG